MAEEEKKELNEWYKKVYDYDPSEEEVLNRYSKEFIEKNFAKKEA